MEMRGRHYPTVASFADQCLFSATASPMIIALLCEKQNNGVGLATKTLMFVVELRVNTIHILTERFWYGANPDH